MRCYRPELYFFSRHGAPSSNPSWIPRFVEYLHLQQAYSIPFSSSGPHQLPRSPTRHWQHRESVRGCLYMPACTHIANSYHRRSIPLARRGAPPPIIVRPCMKVFALFRCFSSYFELESSCALFVWFLHIYRAYSIRYEMEMHGYLLANCTIWHYYRN